MKKKMLALFMAVSMAVSPCAASLTGISVSAKETEETSLVQASGSKEMYRMYNPNSGEHFYTASAGERDSLMNAGWRYEGVGWYAPSSGKPVYRLYNPNAGDHHYTVYAGEKNDLVKAGWRYEGVGWYSGGSVPVYRQYNPNAKTGTHNYTTSKGENDALVSKGWSAEGIGWYAQGTGKAVASASASTQTSVTGPTWEEDYKEQCRKKRQQILNDPEPLGYEELVLREPDIMSAHDYGRLLVRKYPEFQKFDQDVKKCTSDLGKVIAIQKYFYDNDYIAGYPVKGKDAATFTDFYLGKSPYGTCIACAKLTLILGEIADLPTVLVDDDTHAWNEVKINGEWYAIDNVTTKGVSYKNCEIHFFRTWWPNSDSGIVNDKEFLTGKTPYDAPLVSYRKKPTFKGVELDEFTMDFQGKRIEKNGVSFNFSELGFNG